MIAGSARDVSRQSSQQKVRATKNRQQEMSSTEGARSRYCVSVSGSCDSELVEEHLLPSAEEKSSQ